MGGGSSVVVLFLHSKSYYLYTPPLLTAEHYQNQVTGWNRQFNICWAREKQGEPEEQTTQNLEMSWMWSCKAWEAHCFLPTLAYCLVILSPDARKIYLLQSALLNQIPADLKVLSGGLDDQVSPIQLYHSMSMSKMFCSSTSESTLSISSPKRVACLDLQF